MTQTSTIVDVGRIDRYVHIQLTSAAPRLPGVTGCRFDGCTTTRNVQLAISPADRSVTVYVEVQLPDQDAPLQDVLSSLRVG